MGVSGCGKSVVGRAVAEKLGYVFVDADDHHPQANIDKMSQGTPLTDADREPWLQGLNQLLRDAVQDDQPLVLACSALKETYRQKLGADLDDLRWLYLKADFQTIYQRMQARTDHFMPPQLLRSQFDTLQEPRDACVVTVEDDLQTTIQRALDTLTDIAPS